MSEKVPFSQWVDRWCHVLRSHRPSQLGWRAFYLLQRRCFPLLPKLTCSKVESAPSTPRGNSGFDDLLRRQMAIREVRSDLQKRLDQLMAGEFCFLNETRSLGRHAEIDDRNAAAVSHLWRFQFHYQEYLLDLLAAERNGISVDASRHIWPLVETWIRDNPIDRSGALADAWHPYCLSRRLPVWLLLWHAGAIPDEHRPELARSLEVQTRYLERHLEWDLRGNHLLENLRALVLAGAFLQGPDADRRLSTAVRHFDTQLDEQLLPSGEHFERSPMYHAEMLSAVLDVRDVTGDLCPEFSARFASLAHRMAVFLQGILHPDGQIPQLGDSSRLETQPPAILIESARRGQGDSAAPVDGAAQVGDCWTWRDGGDYLLFDHGAVGADELPAHAHNDLLTIEVSLGGRRFLVDSGVFDYADSVMRRYCRSTAAHNVLQVDGQEQCDVWSRFRMGRRGVPTGFVAGSDGDVSWCVATHSAFARWGACQVGRWVACRPGGPWIVADWALGKGRHELVHWLHLAPEVRVHKHDDGRVMLTLGSSTVALRYASPGSLEVAENWHCPGFGLRLAAPVLTFKHSVALPAMIVWTMSWSSDASRVTVESDADGCELVVWEDATGRTTWSPMSLGASAST